MKPHSKRVTKKADSDHKKSLVLADRPYGYLLGLAILPAAFIGFLIGFASPYWQLRNSSSGSTMVHGLWLVCRQESGSPVDCQQTVIRAEDWLRGVQFLEAMGLIFLLLACLFAIILNCTKKRVHTRLLEIFTGAGALFAIFGVFAYLFLTLSPRDTTDDVSYNWSFGINMTGSLLALLSAILLATHNPPPPPKSSPQDRTTQWVHEHEGPRPPTGLALQSYKPVMAAAQERPTSLMPYAPPSPKLAAPDRPKALMPYRPPSPKIVLERPKSLWPWRPPSPKMVHRPGPKLVPVPIPTPVPVMVPRPVPPPPILRPQPVPFGRRVLRVLDPRRLVPFRQEPVQSRPVLVLPPPYNM